MKTAPEPDVVYRGNFLTLSRMPGNWEAVLKASAVCVLAIRDGQVLGVEQPRPVIGQSTWELPAGLIDEGETPLEAVTRELAEEAQLAGDMSLITAFYSSPGFTDEHTTLYLASNLRPASGVPDASEDITVVWRDLAELREAFEAGELVTSSSTAVGLAWAFQLA